MDWRKKLPKAKAIVRNRKPYYAMANLRIPIVETQVIPTACMDMKGVMRINPKFADTLTPANLAGVLIHEYAHEFLGHVERMQGMDPAIYNQAADAEIHQDKDILDLLGDSVSPVTLESLGIEPLAGGSLSAEKIYNIIKQQSDDSSDDDSQSDDSQSDDSNSDSDDNSDDSNSDDSSQGDDDSNSDDGSSDSDTGDDSDSGTGSDSDGEPGDDGTGNGTGCSGDKVDNETQQKFNAEDAERGNEPGKSKATREEVKEVIREQIRSYQNSGQEETRGTVPGNLSQWAAHKPEPPKRKIPWQRHLLSAIGGEGEANRTSSYSRIYRRQDCYGWDDIIMPGEESQGYQIGIIVDTSGSMRRYMAGLLDSLTALLRTVEGSQVEAAFCTTSVQAVSRFAKITSANEHLFGVGGGTDLVCGFEYFDKKRRDKPRLVIVATDGETPYPYRSKHDYKVIVLLTKNCNRNLYPIPTNYTIIETY
tara:strand:+ start:1082 stop:2512 length:1431 start_codon:yes stop_codon:yes gene_type:complete